MKQFVSGLIILAIFCVGIAAPLSAARGPEAVMAKFKDYDSYLEHYPYMTYRGVALTFDTEFDWPEGFHRLDSTELTGFQEWISWIPLWNPTRPVGSQVEGILYQPGEISRPINLPWRTTRFFDFVIPMQLLAEYDIAMKSAFDFAIQPRVGVLLTYQEWLEGNMVKNAHDSIYFVPAETKRQPAESEFDNFFGAISANSNYRSLVENCDSVVESGILPGDMLIAHDEKGYYGRAYTILCVIENDNGERRFIVGTGCNDNPCDFYIPLFNDNKDNPWITLDQLKALAPAEYPHHGFFRFKRQ
ncbi:MAG: DUF4846 domain-containing protein [Candidatus Zixiibacteriota bacterium]|jgi:hypothetical protein